MSAVLRRLLARALALVPLTLVATLLGAQSFLVEKATVRAAPEATAFDAGSSGAIGVWMTIEEGWHTNSHQPTFEYLIPTEARVDLPEGWTLDGIDYPPGKLATFAFEEQPLSVYEGEVAILVRFTVPPTATNGDYEAAVALTYQACDDRSCLAPVTSRQSVALTVGAGGTPIEGALPRAADASPVAASGGSGGSDPSLGWILMLAVLGGLILNAMPCVLPVLSLKVLGLVKSAGDGRRHVTLGALSTALGILLSFWALAAAAVLAKSAGAAVGWGVQFQEPTFVAALAIIVVLFTLNLWGLFEIPLPSWLARGGGGGGEGLAGHLASGFFATLMATPCSAPFLGTAVAFGLAQPPAVIFAVFTAVGVGMALPYLLLAAFPGAARVLPKPGAWMATLRTVMGFLLAAAAVWLFYVLAAQLPPERLAFLQLALLAMALFVWLANRPGGRRRFAHVGTLLAIVAALYFAASGRDAGRKLAAAETVALLDWVTFDRAEAEALAAEGRLVFVDVTADWCFTCKVNERLVLETEEIDAAFERHGVVAMKADWTNRDDAIAQFLADHGRYGIPFYLLYRPGREPLVLGELLTKDGVVAALEEAAS